MKFYILWSVCITVLILLEACTWNDGNAPRGSAHVESMQFDETVQIHYEILLADIGHKVDSIHLKVDSDGYSENNFVVAVPSRNRSKYVVDFQVPMGIPTKISYKCLGGGEIHGAYSEVVTAIENVVLNSFPDT